MRSLYIELKATPLKPIELNASNTQNLVTKPPTGADYILPSNTVRVALGDLYDSPVTPGTFPEKLTHLKFGYLFNQPIRPGTLPRHLKVLSFGDRFAQQLDIIPTTLTHLTLGEDFNYDQLPQLHDSLVRLTVSSSCATLISAAWIPERTRICFITTSPHEEKFYHNVYNLLQHGFTVELQSAHDTNGHDMTTLRLVCADHVLCTTLFNIFFVPLLKLSFYFDSDWNLRIQNPDSRPFLPPDCIIM
eukprot:gene12773-14985_t